MTNANNNNLLNADDALKAMTEIVRLQDKYEALDAKRNKAIAARNDWTANTLGEDMGRVRRALAKLNATPRKDDD